MNSLVYKVKCCIETENSWWITVIKERGNEKRIIKFKIDIK